MWIVPEAAIADLITPEASFDAVEAVFAAMATGDAYNFPVIREAIGHEDALYGFKGGFRPLRHGAGAEGGRLLAQQPGKAWHHQPPVHRVPVRSRYRQDARPWSAATC